MGLVGQPPWHLWGTTEVVDVTTTGFAPGVSTPQLSRISYKRPETWSFFLAAELIDGPLSGVPATIVTVDWQVQFGVGRAMFDTQFSPLPGLAADQEGFAQFVWNVPVGSRPGAQPGNKKFATTIMGPVLDDGASTPSDTRQPIDHLVAQDIQVSANIFVVSQAGTLRVKLYSFFAPRTHVRPEWFSDGSNAQRFRGNETGGT